MDLVKLVHRGLSLREFALAAARAVRPAVPFDGVCVLTFDPATLLPTSEVTENALPEAAFPRMTEIEVAEVDFNKFVDLARASRPAASLSEATEGDLDRSLRQREVRRPNGWLGDELRAALVNESATWGGITLLRDAGPAFTPADVRFLSSLSRHLAEGIRLSVLLTAVTQAPAEVDAGLLVLAADNSIEMANAAAQRWLDELGTRGTNGGPLPSVVQAVASRARSAAARNVEGDASARARIRTPSGQWLLVRGSMLGDPADERAAVILEAAQPPHLAPLIADAHGFTERERLVTQLVAQGLSTSEIANRLHISPYTVQDHLKSIFDKAGVSTRGELVAHMFFTHYAPRLTSGTPIEPTGWFAPTPTSEPATTRDRTA